MTATGFGIGTGAGGAILDALSHTLSNQSKALSERHHRTSRFYDEDDNGVEEDPYPISKADDWKLMPEVKMFHQQGQQDNLKDRKLGVTWQNLTVKGVSSDATYNENILSQFNVVQSIRDLRHKAPLTTILDKSHGCVKPGEMLLVLGRPGSGCTTLLKMLANHREGYAEVTGDVRYVEV